MVLLELFDRFAVSSVTPFLWRPTRFDPGIALETSFPERDLQLHQSLVDMYVWLASSVNFSPFNVLAEVESKRGTEVSREDFKISLDLFSAPSTVH